MPDKENWTVSPSFQQARSRGLLGRSELGWMRRWPFDVYEGFVRRLAIAALAGVVLACGSGRSATESPTPQPDKALTTDVLLQQSDLPPGWTSIVEEIAFPQTGLCRGGPIDGLGGQIVGQQAFGSAGPAYLHEAVLRFPPGVADRYFRQYVSDAARCEPAGRIQVVDTATINTAAVAYRFELTNTETFVYFAQHGELVLMVDYIAPKPLDLSRP